MKKELLLSTIFVLLIACSNDIPPEPGAPGVIG